jgi:hypothetical protein
VRVCCIVRKWLWRMDTSRTRQVRMKVNDDTREKLGQSTKRNATIPRQGGRGSYRGRFVCLFTKCDQKVGIFYLPRFVEDRGRICYSRGSLPCFFLHVHMLRVNHSLFISSSGFTFPHGCIIKSLLTSM